MDYIATYTPEIDKRAYPPNFQIRSYNIAADAMQAAEEIRSDGDSAEPYIEGYFAVFDKPFVIRDNPAICEYETIDPHAFDATLGEDIRALTNHDTSMVLGRNKANTLQLAVHPKGLWGRIAVNRYDTDALNTWHRVRRKDVTQCSIGFVPLEYRTETTTDADGKRTYHYIVIKALLLEVSVCTFPAYKDTSIDAGERSTTPDDKSTEDVAPVGADDTRDWGMRILPTLAAITNHTGG